MTGAGCGTQRIRVLLLAENRLVRDALARLLAKKPDIVMVGSAPVSKRFIEQVRPLLPDVMILDRATFEQPDSAASDLQRQLPTLKTIVFGMDSGKEMFIRAVRQGIVGYLLKEDSAHDLLKAIRAVMNHEVICSRILLRSLFDHVAQQARPCSIPPTRAKGFTRRQQQLLRLVGDGLTNKEIAAFLNLSEQTVKNHIHRMLHETGADNRLRLAEMMGIQLFGRAGTGAQGFSLIS